MRRLLFLLVTLTGLLATGLTFADPAEPSRDDLRALADLLRKPVIQSWLQSQAEGTPAGGEQALAATQPENAQQVIAGRLSAVRVFLGELAAAVPALPGELGRAWKTLAIELEERGLLSIVVLLAAFAALGCGVEGLFWWATTGLRRRLIATRLDTVHDRLRAVGLRFGYGIGVLLAFTLGSVGAFLLFDWPPLLKEIILGYLLVFLIIRLTLVLGRILLAPGAERFRVVPMATATARFWFSWSAVLVGWFIFVKVTLDVLAALGIGRAAWYLIGQTCGIVLLGLALFVVWRHPARDGGPATAGRGHRLGTWLVSLYLVAVWLLLFTGSVTPFHVGIALLLLAIALRGTRLGVNHVLRPAGGPSSDDTVPSLTTVSLERGLRAALLIGGAYLIAWILDLDLGALTARDTLATRLLRGAINAAIIALLADFVWHVASAWIDGKVAEAAAGDPADGDEARHRARVRTLLPILKNVLFVVVIATAAMMALSALGVEIGPLIAGAGVAGIAIGFGAQTLVKDIISGMFYLLDDAFRVGEYIQSGNYKGTVESFSLRSVKLRHHRGPLYTVPFGTLGAVQNMSRDWVIDKLTVGVTYDTDIDKARKIVKQIGKELAQDPEFAAKIIEPLKMQGVEQFGDFAIQLRMKMTTQPGEQFDIRRRAYALIKQAFDANGIKFAFPTVQVAGDIDASTAAVAQRGLELVQPKASPGG